MKILNRSLILLLAFLMCSCSSLSSMVERPQLSVDDFRLTDASLFRQTFKVRLKVDNPNSFALPILGLDYGVNIAGVDITQGTTNEGVRIPGNGSDYLEIDFDTNLMKSLPDLMDVVKSGGKNLDYKLDGNVRLDNAFFKQLPFSKSGTFDLRL
ncbi:MAG: LEA type 2 family protein [Gammaproteobacteria bacterium]|nr:LEA type 2 family protein [Gammaproteobacteria bacterium]NNM14733.1 LEA type 2 family protein [Gammaproteobacteria bacterium]